jgi:hypothetical protein
MSLITSGSSINHFENKLPELRNLIQTYSNWHEGSFTVLINQLMQLAKDVQSFQQLCVVQTENTIDSILNMLETCVIPDLEAIIDAIRLNNNTALWENYCSALKQLPSYGQPFDGLISAVYNKDPDLYEQSLREALKLYDFIKNRKRVVEEIKRTKY